MKKTIGLIITVLISCSLFGANNRSEAEKYYDSQGIITGKTDHKIRTLDFTGLDNPVNVVDLELVQYFPEVEAIHLSGCNSITNESLKYLSGLKKLEILNLDETKITDEGLKYLKDLKSLRELDLTSTKVTDKGIQELASLKNLRNLVVYKTKVTQKGVNELQKKIPDCYIDLAGDNY